MPKLLTLLILALIFTGCGNDPITNAGYFDDDVDRSTTTTTNYSNDESTTSNSNNSTNSNNTTTNNYYHDSIIVVHDTLTRTVTKRVTDTTVIRDTVSLTDTITVHTVSVDTIVKTMRDVVRDTLKITVHDTLVETSISTDTIMVPTQSFFESLNTDFDTLPEYKHFVFLNDEWKIFLQRPLDKYGKALPKILLGASRREGAPVSKGTPQITFIGKNKPLSTDVTYKVMIYGDTVSDDAIKMFYDDHYGSSNDYPASAYVHPDHDKMYNNCIIITQLEIGYFRKETATFEPRNEEWNGRKKLCW